METPTATVTPVYNTLQEVFNKVIDHFIVKKNPPGLAADGRCSYVAGCAIGCCVPDPAMRQRWEQLGTYDSLEINIYGVFQRFPEDYAAVFGKISVNALNSLQSGHDRSARSTRNNPADFTPVFARELREFARRLNLTSCGLLGV